MHRPQEDTERFFTLDFAVVQRSSDDLSPTDPFHSHLVKVVGPIEDNDYFQELVRLTKQFQIQDKVVFLGKVSQAQLHDEYLSIRRVWGNEETLHCLRVG